MERSDLMLYFIPGIVLISYLSAFPIFKIFEDNFWLMLLVGFAWVILLSLGSWVIAGKFVKAKGLTKIIGKTSLVDILFEINKNGKDKYAMGLARSLSKNVSNIMELLRILEKYGLISKEKKGRRVIIKLTKKGQKVTNLFLELNEVLK